MSLCLAVSRAANASSLLGNLLYAMEYRNQDVELSNGSKMNIPENVIFIFTENTLDARNELDLAVRRRMSYGILFSFTLLMDMKILSEE